MARCDKGFSFLFHRVDDKSFSTSVESHELAAIFAQHPDLLNFKLSEVWCHGCANCLWPLMDESIAWSDDWFRDETAPEHRVVKRWPEEHWPE